MLDDPDDTAVVTETALALLEREDLWGLDLVLEAVVESAEDAVDRLLYAIGTRYTPDTIGGIGRLVEQRAGSGGW